MHILLLTSDLPSAHAHHGGGRLTYRWVKELSAFHSYSLLSFVRREEEDNLSDLEETFAEVRTVPAERGFLNRLVRSPLLCTRPFPVAATASRRLRAGLRAMLATGSYDCVQMENFHMGQYSRFIPTEIPRVLVFQDLAGQVLRQQVWLARGLKKYYYFHQWKLSSHWEKWYAIWSRNVFVMSLKDRREVDSWDVGVKTFIMPPLLDPGLFSLPERNRDRGTVLFIGALHRPGNIDAVIRLKEDIMPRVKRELPGTKCLVVGADPPAAIRRLAAGDFIVTGKVDKVAPYLSSASLLAVPLRVAGGIILKIIEAMTVSCPVVATRAANAGVGARDGREILLADRSEDFAGAMVRLLKSSEERKRLGRAGRSWVEEKFNRAESRKKMLAAFRRIIARD